ncbi:hypothetical protein AAU33_14520 [Listeria monocytogenes]|nr:hypothetical protein [Listeria monocytogenes]ECB9721510.1 hypothetical protein [Listeria monocytogenes]
MSKKLFKWLVVIIFFMFSLFFITNAQTVIDAIILFNLDITSENLFLLCLIFFIEICVFLIIYDLLILESYSFISFRIEKLGRILITKKNVELALFTIRVNYNIARVFKFLRLGWLRYDNPNLSSVWVGISKSTLFPKIFVIIRAMICLPVMLAIVLTLFTLNIINLDWVYSQWEYLFGFLKKAFTIKINFGDIFSKLPAVVALLTIVPVLFFFYFHSQKREVRKIIDRKNNELFESVVIKHNELSKLISKSIYTISENLDYVINCQPLIVDLILNKKIKNMHELKDGYYLANRNVEAYLFKEIPGILKIAEVIVELTSEELDYFTRLFSMKKYEIWHFYWEFGNCKTSEKLNRLFLTKQGVNEMISEVRELTFEISKEELTTYENKQQAILSYNIYDALETLYSLKRYNESLKRYLTSSKTEKTLMKTLAKEKQN